MKLSANTWSKIVMGLSISFGMAFAIVFCNRLISEQVQTVPFQSLDDMKTFAQKKGYHVCHIDRSKVGLESHLFISTEPIAPKYVQSLRKSKIQTDPQWSNLVYAVEYAPANQVSYSNNHFPKDCLVWNNIVLAGDASLLHRLADARP